MFYALLIDRQISFILQRKAYRDNGDDDDEMKATDVMNKNLFTKSNIIIK